MTDQDPTAARLQYLAQVLANPPASRQPCAANCGQPLTRWNVDAQGRHWHPDCLPAGTAMPITRSGREWQALLDQVEATLDRIRIWAETTEHGTAATEILAILDSNGRTQQ